jgi:hypothetical protein
MQVNPRVTTCRRVRVRVVDARAKPDKSYDLRALLDEALQDSRSGSRSNAPVQVPDVPLTAEDTVYNAVSAAGGREELPEASNASAKSVLDFFRGADVSEESAKAAPDTLVPGDVPQDSGRGFLEGFKPQENPMKSFFEGLKAPDVQGSEATDTARELADSGKRGIQSFMEALTRPADSSEGAASRGSFDKLRGSPGDSSGAGTSIPTPSLEDTLSGGQARTSPPQLAAPKFEMPQVPKFERPSFLGDGTPENVSQPSLTPDSGGALAPDQVSPPPILPSSAAQQAVPQPQPPALDNLPVTEAASSVSEASTGAQEAATESVPGPQVLEQLKANTDALVAGVQTTYQDSVAKVSRALSFSLPEPPALPPEVQSQVTVVRAPRLRSVRGIGVVFSSRVYAS